jgi:hypothetical protein
MDTTILLREIDLKALAEEAGAQFNNSNSSRCPLHNGNNPHAFHIYRGQDGIQHYHCFTNCPEGANGGDAIAFYMRWKQVDFKQALLDLGRRVGLDNQPAPGPARNKPTPVAHPMIDVPGEPPCEQWRSRALQFVNYAALELAARPDAMTYLVEDRFLTVETIHAFGLGFNPANLYDDPAKWGITDNRRMWLPAGIVIPHERDGELHFVNVRRAMVGDRLAERTGLHDDKLLDAKFVGVRGGKRGLFGKLTGKPVAILAEGEFDCMLAWQCARDFCDVATLGGARHRLDVYDAANLSRASVIVAILDADMAGERGSEYLAKVSPRVILCQPPDHDLTDAIKRGVDLRKWLAGLVAEKMERLLNNLNEHRQPDVFERWLAVYQVAIKAEVGDE